TADADLSSIVARSSKRCWSPSNNRRLRSTTVPAAGGTARDACAPSRFYVMPPASGRLAELGVEMPQPRQHVVLQQRERMLPGLRLVLVVETEHQEHAEAADFAIDGLDLFGDRRRRADDPVLARAIVDGDVAVGHVGRMLEVVLEAEMAEQRQ